MGAGGGWQDFLRGWQDFLRKTCTAEGLTASTYGNGMERSILFFYNHCSLSNKFGETTAYKKEMKTFISISLVLVGMTRFELATSGPPDRCATGLRHIPFQSRRGDSNARPPRPERGALPTALLLEFFGLSKNSTNPLTVRYFLSHKAGYPALLYSWK